MRRGVNASMVKIGQHTAAKSVGDCFLVFIDREAYTSRLSLASQLLESKNTVKFRLDQLASDYCLFFDIVTLPISIYVPMGTIRCTSPFDSRTPLSQPSAAFGLRGLSARLHYYAAYRVRHS